MLLSTDTSLSSAFESLTSTDQQIIYCLILSMAEKEKSTHQAAEYVSIMTGKKECDPQEEEIPCPECGSIDHSSICFLEEEAKILCLNCGGRS